MLAFSRQKSGVFTLGFSRQGLKKRRHEIFYEMDPRLSCSLFIVARFGLKPCWLSGNNLFDSRKVDICSQTIFSSNFEAAGRQLTGLQFSLIFGSPFLRNGVMRASFQFSGNFPSSIKVLMIFVREILIEFAPMMSCSWESPSTPALFSCLAS